MKFLGQATFLINMAQILPRFQIIRQSRMGKNFFNLRTKFITWKIVLTLNNSDHKRQEEVFLIILLLDTLKIEWIYLLMRGSLLSRTI